MKTQAFLVNGISGAISATVVTALGIGTPTLPGIAQTTTSQGEIQIPPSVLAEIREAPFSELFTVADGKGYGVKDQDYNPAEPEMGFFTLWANVPEDGRLGLVVKYCFEDTSLARANAELVEVTLSNGDTELVKIDQVVDSRPAYLNEIRPPRTSNVSTSFYYDPFFDPYYYSPFGFGVSYSPQTYIPGVECSTGLTFFDLVPVQAELATLPDTTLNVRLLFSNGATEYWNLGGGTVSAIKQLPTIANLP